MKELNYKSIVKIRPRKPFNFESTVYKPSHFFSTTDKYENGILYFLMNWKNKVYGIKLFKAKKNIIIVEIFSSDFISNGILNEIRDEISFRFDMDSDLKKFIKLAQRDSILRPIERKWRGIRPSCAYSLYELLCISVVLQNAQISRSIKMLEIMLNNYGKKIKFDNVELSAFWSPNDIIKSTEEDLRALKIGYRAKSFIRISDFFVNNPNFEFKLRSLPKKDALKELLKIYGVGQASAWYILFEKLHHYNAFDYISPWENKILSMLIFNTMDRPADEILNYAKEKWGDFRMLAVHYIFEDLFWKHENKNIEWLNKLIRQ